MSYRKADFGKALLNELDRGYDVKRLAKWAYEVHLDHADDLEDGLNSEMMTVVAMSEGPEFQLKENELRRLAARLLEA